MAAISIRFGSGGANLTPGGSGVPSLATALRDIADDLAALKAGATPVAITSPNATDLASAELLVNEIKTKLNAMSTATAAVAIKTTKV